MSNIFSTYIIPFTLAITMLGMGLSLQKRDFINIFIYPKALMIGVIFKLILLPIIAYIITRLFSLSPELSVGLILVSACPGGSTTNLLSYLFRANLALSISMTTLSSIISLFSIPVIINLALLIFLGKETEITLPIGDTIFNLFILTLLPTFIGVFLRHKKPHIAESLDKPLRYILPALLLLTFGLYFVISHKTDPINFKEAIVIFSAGIIFNILSMIIGNEVGRNLKISLSDRITIIIEIGLQNTALGIFIAGTLLNNYKIGLVSIIYSSFSFFSTAIFIFIFKKFLKN
jgi:BASS family bile acid:Na+ symporter